MAHIMIIENNLNLGEAYAQALEGTGHVVKIIESDTEATDYLVRQRRAPDIVILDMRQPGGAEMLVMSAVQRLSHLAHTKVLAITRQLHGEQRAGQSWGADLLVSAPFSADELRRAIHTLSAGLVSKVPTCGETPVRDTRVWWEGVEAVFMRWTNEALVVAWADATDTAVKIPRGAVIRLLHKGVLQIEGFVPVWVRLSPPDFSRADPVHAMAGGATTSVAGPESEDARADAGDQGRRATTSLSQTATARLDKPSDRFNVVARLIRRLAGSGDPQRQRTPSQVIQGSS